MIRGTCLCGATKFTLDGELHSVRYCHCANCRKFSGTSPATWAMAEASRLTVAPTNPPIGRFNSGKGIRCFCLKCGSPTWFESLDYPSVIGIPLGVIDDFGGDPPQPEMHLWVRSKPAWCAILDDLPQYDGPPGSPEPE